MKENDMARYYEGEALRKAICRGCNEEFSDAPCEPSECLLLRGIQNLPTADVAPKSEVERWRRNLEAVLEERAETKQEIAMEIFEDLESMIYEHGVINCHKLAELKKKYTEVEG